MSNVNELATFIAMAVGIISIIGTLVSIYVVAIKGAKHKAIQEKRFDDLEIDYNEHKIEAVANQKENLLNHIRLEKKLDDVVQNDIVPMKEDIASMNAKLGIVVKKIMK